MAIDWTTITVGALVRPINFGPVPLGLVVDRDPGDLRAVVVDWPRADGPYFSPIWLAQFLARHCRA